MNTDNINKMLTLVPELKKRLYARGFLVTDKTLDKEAHTWSRWNVHGLTVLIAPEQRCHIYSGSESTVLLIGHAYDPFSMQVNETDIVKELAEAEPADFFEIINRLTGVFTIVWKNEEGLHVVGDATGMQTTFYAEADGHVYISSHTNLLGDLLNLEWDPYVKRLASYRFFKLLGNALPGDLTQFSSVKRLVPNHYITFQNGAWKSRRFYWPAAADVSYEDAVAQSADILHRNLQLIAEKWERPAISMTGGCDSKTTLACAEGLYDRFRYFSYISSEAERVDAEAAAKICADLGLPHEIHLIPERDSDVELVEETRMLLNWNTGNLRNSNANDVRKRAWYLRHVDFDVEVKSWASEVGRAYYSKRFNGRTKFPPKPTPRACTTLYKFFLHDRKLVRDTDQVFAAYLENYFEQAKTNPVPWQEQFFWEFRVPSWNGLVITGEHRYSFDITIPYNNRKLLELMLSVPLEDRIADRLHKDIRAKMNPKVDESGIAVTNLKHTNKRAIMEDVYWRIHSRLPF